MATYQEQIAKYTKLNERRAVAERSLDTLTNCLINRLLPLEQAGELKITAQLLTAIVHAVADAAKKNDGQIELISKSYKFRTA